MPTSTAIPSYSTSRADPGADTSWNHRTRPRVTGRVLKSPMVAQLHRARPNITAHVPKLPRTSQSYRARPQITIGVLESPITSRNHYPRSGVTVSTPGSLIAPEDCSSRPFGGSSPGLTAPLRASGSSKSRRSRAAARRSGRPYRPPRRGLRDIRYSGSFSAIQRSARRCSGKRASRRRNSGEWMQRRWPSEIGGIAAWSSSW